MSSASRIRRRQQRERDRISKAESAAYARGHKAATHELTRWLTPADLHGERTVYLTEPPRQPVVRLTDFNGWGRIQDFDEELRRAPFEVMQHQLEVVCFKARQRAIRLPSGHTAVWYDWEPMY